VSRAHAFLCVISAFVSSASSSRAEGAICFDQRNTVSTDAPPGWVADYEAGNRLGLCVLFHPTGTSFDSAPAVIYPNLVTTAESLSSFIEGDLEAFTKKRAGAKVENLPGVGTGTDMAFELRRLSNGPPPTEQEIIAYHAADGAMFLAVLSARTVKNLDDARPAFETFLVRAKIIPRRDLYPKLASLAADDRKKSGGADYERRYFSSIGPRLSDAMRACAKPGSKGFSAVFQITERGSIGDWVNQGTDPLGDCVRARMKGAEGPPPPFAPFHINLDMSIQK
jgi:hypothetical protein